MHIAFAVRGASACLLIASFSSSTVAAASPGPVRSLLEIRQQRVIVQQWDMSCGAAALATILTYQLDDPVPEKQVAQGMLRRTDPLRVKHRGGFSLLDMKRYAEGRGYEADGYSSLTLENLRKLAPAVVPVRLEGYDHFIIFRGVAAGAAVIADPAFGNRKLPPAEFKEVWNGNIAFVVRRKNQPNAANRIAPRNADFIAVQEESIRAALDAGVPVPLADWELTNLSWARNRSTAAGSRAATATSPRRMSSDAAGAVAAAGPGSLTQVPGVSPGAAVPLASAPAPMPQAITISPPAVQVPSAPPPVIPSPTAPVLPSINTVLPPAVQIPGPSGLASNSLAPLSVPLLPALLGR